VRDEKFREDSFNRWERTYTMVLLRSFTEYERFHRMWTLQEISLAARATIMIGTHKISWETLYTAYNIIEERIGKDTVKSLGFHTDRVTFPYRSFRQESFRDLVLNTRERRASERLDTIFALLSHPAALDPETGEPFIEVDYGKSLQRVYAEATLIMIREKHNLDDISYASHGRNLDGPWPSWVPMWHDKPTASWLLQNTSQHFTSCGI